MSDARAIRDHLVEQADASGFGAHGLHVSIGGQAAEHRWYPDVREDVHSVAKGLCALVAGTAAADGAIDLDEPVAGVLTGFAVAEASVDVSFRHLLSMTSGIDMPWSDDLALTFPDLAAEFFSRPSRGRVFQYSGVSTYVAMRALERRIGDVGAFAQERLFDPLGIRDVAWQRCPLGFVVGAAGVALTTEELARVGDLLRRGGPLVDPMHTGWIETGSPAPYDRYALAGWAGPGRTWRLHGAHGQLVVVDPVADAVVTVTADDHAGADASAARVAEALASTA